MGLFNTILNKLGFSHPDVAAAAPAPVAAAEPAVADTPPPAPAAPEAMDMVDVVANLEALAANSAEPLNWKTSIVDLLKLLGMDSSLASRKQLATELDCPAAAMGDSASMNLWLHKTVLQKIAANGGNVPDDLL